MDRNFPDFVVIGAARAGTTTLHKLLAQIPSICLTDFKECNFFVEEFNYGKGSDWYRGLFKHPEKICGDVSPLYAMNDRYKGVPERLKEHAPNAKIIMITRDPVERAWSHYKQLYYNRTDVSYIDEFPGSDSYDHVVNTSRFMSQLRPYLDLFDRQQFLFLRFKDLNADPRKVIGEICGFVGAEVSDAELEALKLETFNSSAGLSNMPSWWTQMARSVRQSQSPFLRRAINHMPRGPVKALKRLVPSGRKSDKPDLVRSDRILEMFSEDVAEDYQEFREFARF